MRAKSSASTTSGDAAKAGPARPISSTPPRIETPGCRACIELLPIAAMLTMTFATLTGCGRGVNMRWSSDTPQSPARMYPSATIDEDRDRLREGKPLKYHDDEAALRRHEFERDFYNDFYQTRREPSPPAPGFP